MKKFWIVLTVVILAAGGGTAWFLSRDTQASAQVLYPTTTVQKGTLESDVSGSGDLTPATDEDIVIGAADTSKTISTVNVSADNTVKKGAALLTFTDGTTLTAPASGTITKVNVYAGNRVTEGRAVMHLTSYSDLNTVVQIDELDIPKIKTGQNVAVTVNAYPNKTFSGKVTQIANQGTDTNGVSTFDVTVHMNQSAGLKPGMTTTASIVLKKRTNVLYLPSGAVHQAGNQSYVYLSSETPVSSAQNSGFRRFAAAAMDQKQGRMATIQTGIHNDQSIEITSGLSAGQTVQLTAITRQSSTASTSTSSQSSYGAAGFGAGQGSGGAGNGKALRRYMRNGGSLGQ